MTVRELQNLAPVIDWTSYFNYAFKQINREVQSSQELVVYAPEFVRKMSELVTQYLSTNEGKVYVVTHLPFFTMFLLTRFLVRLPGRNFVINLN